VIFIEVVTGGVVLKFPEAYAGQKQFDAAIDRGIKIGLLMLKKENPHAELPETLESNKTYLIRVKSAFCADETEVKRKIIEATERASEIERWNAQPDGGGYAMPMSMAAGIIEPISNGWLLREGNPGGDVTFFNSSDAGLKMLASAALSLEKPEKLPYGMQPPGYPGNNLGDYLGGGDQ